MAEQPRITAAEERAADRRKRQTEALRANLKRRKAPDTASEPPKAPETGDQD